MKIYDISMDEEREATQADIENLHSANQALASVRAAVKMIVDLHPIKDLEKINAVIAVLTQK